MDIAQHIAQAFGNYLNTNQLQSIYTDIAMQRQKTTHTDKINSRGAPSATPEMIGKIEINAQKSNNDTN